MREAPPTPRRKPVLFPAIMATLAVAVAAAAAFRLQPMISHGDLSLFFLTAVLFVAAGLGLWPSLYASLLSFFVYNFFFTPPYFTLDVADKTDLARLGFFLLLATVTGHLAGRMRDEMERTRAAAHRSQTLYELSRRMAAVVSHEDALKALVDHFAATFNRPVVALLPGPDGHLVQQAASKSTGRLGGTEISRAQQVMAGRSVAPGAWHHLRMVTARGALGVIGIGAPLTPEQQELAEVLCGQAAVALERTQLAGALEQSLVMAETEQLRAALLASVSQDLRAPLASLVGATEYLLHDQDSITNESRGEILQTIRDQARQLDRHIKSLQETARPGAEPMSFHRDWFELSRIVSAAVSRLGPVLEPLTLKIDTDDVPRLYVHGALIEQVLANLLESAAHRSHEGATISVSARTDEQRVILEISDEGVVIPPSGRDRIFDMFYGAGCAEPGEVSGLGMCRALIGAHGGEISVLEGPHGRGNRVRITLPLELSGNA